MLSHCVTPRRYYYFKEFENKPELHSKSKIPPYIYRAKAPLGNYPLEQSEMKKFKILARKHKMEVAVDSSFITITKSNRDSLENMQVMEEKLAIQPVLDSLDSDKLHRLTQYNKQGNLGVSLLLTGIIWQSALGFPLPVVLILTLTGLYLIIRTIVTSKGKYFRNILIFLGAIIGTILILYLLIILFALMRS